MELKKIEETDNYIVYGYTDEMALKYKNTGKYVEYKNNEFIFVKPKFGIVKLNKGNLKGIDPDQLLDEMIIRPIKYINKITSTEWYLRKIIEKVTKYYQKTGNYLEEDLNIFMRNPGNIYLQDLEDGDIILSDITKEELLKKYGK